MLRIPYDDVDEKPFHGGARVLPTIHRAYAHSPRLPRCTSHYQALEMMD